MANKFEPIADVQHDNLYKSAGALKLIDITTAKDLKKGTVLTSKGAVYQGTDGTDPAFVLAQDVTAAGTAQTVEVWQEGIFFRETIEALMNYTFTDADELALRKNNILLESIVY